MAASSMEDQSPTFRDKMNCEATLPATMSFVAANSSTKEPPKQYPEPSSYSQSFKVLAQSRVLTDCTVLRIRPYIYIKESQIGILSVTVVMIITHHKFP